ncbi:DUF488 domain-containing protein [Brevundimonas sp.]
MAQGRIFSIGYGSQTRDWVLDQVEKRGVSYVIDVRSIPRSKFQPDFSQEPLDAALKQIGKRYVFMGAQLGGRPKDLECYTDGKVDYSKTRRKRFFTEGIDRLQSAFEQGLTVCLLCSESHPTQCHRSKLIGEALKDRGIDTEHIMPDGSSESQAEVISALTKGQGTLFGEHFASRKTYI